MTMFPHSRGRSLLPMRSNAWHSPQHNPLLPRTRSLGAPLDSLNHPHHYHQHRRTVPFPEEALFHYLPVFTARDFRSHSDVDRIVSAWIRHNPETNPALACQLLEEDLRLAFDLILDALSEADYGETTHSTSRRVLAELEYRFEEDAQLGPLRGGSHSLRRSQSLFRALAEISHSGRSYPIGSVLVTFFLTRVSMIARVSHARTLAMWCYAIARAHIREDERIDCLGRVLRLRPDLIEELAEEGSPRCLRVARLLDQARMYAGVGTSDVFSHPQRRSRSPPWASGIGSRDFGRRRGLEDEDVYDEYDDYRFAENDSRYLRRLEESKRHHEIEAERDHEKILELTWGSRYSQGLLTAPPLSSVGSRYNQGLLTAPPLSHVGRDWHNMRKPLNTSMIEYDV